MFIDLIIQSFIKSIIVYYRRLLLKISVSIDFIGIDLHLVPKAINIDARPREDYDPFSSKKLTDP